MNFLGLIIFLTFWNLNHAGKRKSMETNMKPAVFFDWKEEKLVEISKFDDKTICKSCVSACPVASNAPKEKLLNEKASITGNGIFLRDFYPTPIAANEMEIEICENLSTPALAWNYKSLSFDVGFEFYYEEGWIELKSTSYDFYTKVVDGKPKPKWKPFSEDDPVKIDRSGQETSFEVFDDRDENGVIQDESKPDEEESPSEPPLKIIKNGGNTEFHIEAESAKKMVFYWMNVLSFDVSNELKQRVVTFTADTINDFFHQMKTIYYCETYLSGDGRNIENVNIPQNDVGIQILVAKPEEESKTFVDQLIKVQIIPMRMFHTLAARLTTCIYLNFAFIWESIANGQLKKINLFVYAIYREWPSDMIISFGVNGHLKGLGPVTQKEVASEDHLFRRFPIPEVMFRLLEIAAIDKLTYGAVIVIHNNSEPVLNTEKICSTEDEVEGWDDIKNTDSPTGFSYVCPQTKEVLMKLGFNEEQATVDMKPLKLNEFPQYDEKTKQIQYKSVLDKINRRLDDIKKWNLVD